MPLEGLWALYRGMEALCSGFMGTYRVYGNLKTRGTVLGGRHIRILVFGGLEILGSPHGAIPEILWGSGV